MIAPRLYLLCGLPGAGKTTRARRIVQVANAVHLSPDEWLGVLGVSLVDYDFRFKLQRAMLDHAGEVLRGGASVIVEFGSWDRAEREAIALFDRHVGPDDDWQPHYTGDHCDRS